MKNSDTNTSKPTCEEIWNEQLDLVERSVHPIWRHGSRIVEVYKRNEDDTFWRANYAENSSDAGIQSEGFNELRDGIALITQVFPHTVTVTVYSEEKV